MKLTDPQKRILEGALRAPNNVFEISGTNGLARSSQYRCCERLVSAGMLTPYVHGGYEITDRGQSSLMAQS